jgi:LssY C-terminus
MSLKSSDLRQLIVGLKRFAIFVPGAILFILSFYLFFSSLNERLPASIAVIVIYAVTAYITIPLFFRLYNIVKPSTHVPRYCVTPDGLACDPVNIAVSGTRGDLYLAMTAAGWHKADSRSPRTLVKMMLSIILRHAYKNAPFSTLYLFGRGQDIGFQKPLKGSRSAHKRHHVRFWACIPAMMEGKDLEDAGFWEKLYPDTDKGEVLWVGCASRDIGIVPIGHNLQLTHKVKEDTDDEREIIVTDLKSTGLVENVRYVKSGDALTLPNRAMSSKLSTDGTLAIVDLK